MSDSAQALWRLIVSECREQSQSEPSMAAYYQKVVLQHDSLAHAFAANMAMSLATESVSAEQISTVVLEALAADDGIMQSLCNDMRAYVERDPACDR